MKSFADIEKVCESTFESVAWLKKKKTKNSYIAQVPVFCIVYSQPTKTINHRVLMRFHEPLPFCHSKRIPTGYKIFHQYIVCNFFHYSQY
jgi:hypothetical protein